MGVCIGRRDAIGIGAGACTQPRRNEPAAVKSDAAVIFDMDGVLVDSKPAHFASWQASAAARGHRIDRARYDRLFGHGYRVFIRELAGEAIDEAAAVAWYHDKERRYRELVRTDPPVMPGAEDLIRALDLAGYALGIGSAGPRGNVDLVRTSLRVGDRFRACLSADDVPMVFP